jgi:hypothetical protein
MPRYFVTMKLSGADQGGLVRPIEGLTSRLRDALLPSLEYLSALRMQGREVIGGYLSGPQSVVVIMEAESEEQVYEILENLPGWDRANTEVGRLHILEDLSGE